MDYLCKEKSVFPMKKTRNIGLLIIILAASLWQLNASPTTDGLPFVTTATVFHPTDMPVSVHGFSSGNFLKYGMKAGEVSNLTY